MLGQFSAAFEPWLSSLLLRATRLWRTSWEQTFGTVSPPQASIQGSCETNIWPSVNKREVAPLTVALGGNGADYRVKVFGLFWI